VALLPVDQQLLLLSAFGIRNVDKSLELWPDKEAEERIERILASHWLSKRQLLIGINIGSSKKWTSKRWGDRKFIELINQLGSYNFRCVLTGTQVDKPKALKILKSCMNKPIDLVGKTSITELIALIKRCDLFITSDSAPLHIAAAVRTPVIALFGPTDPRRHLPPGKDVYFIWKKQKCSPCYKPKCSRGNKCMDSITVEDVLNKVKQILGDKIEGANSE
jgi:ADP-heptose:LPS heptosyltransferase